MTDQPATTPAADRVTALTLRIWAVFYEAMERERDEARRDRDEARAASRLMREQLSEAQAAVVLLMSDYDDLLAERTPGSEGDPAGGWLPPTVENGTNDVASPEPRYPVQQATITYPPHGKTREDLTRQRDEARAQAVAATTDADDLRAALTAAIDQVSDSRGRSCESVEYIAVAIDALIAPQRPETGSVAPESPETAANTTAVITGPQIGAE